MKKFSFVIAAGGSGSRMGGADVKKQFRILGGRPVWRWSADTAAEILDIGEIVLVLPEEDFNLINLNEWDKNIELKLVKGGASRPESVMNGLNACSFDYVMIHDAARPFLSREIILNLIAATDENTGAIPIIPVTDALKRVEIEFKEKDKKDKKNIKSEKISPVSRDGLFITQTPQAFYKTPLIDAVKKYGANAKDEAEAWLAAKLNLKRVDGAQMNFKITVEDDWNTAKALVNEIYNKNIMIRTGLGYDVHRLVPERKLILGGVLIEDSPLGLLGHSDADLLTHAVADAILGAAGLPDIGNLFPASDEKYRGANSLKLLEEAFNLVNKNWEIVWIDAAVQAQVPRLNKYLPLMRENFIKIFKADCVNIKAKSAELIDDAGMALSMTCWVVATLKKFKKF